MAKWKVRLMTQTLAANAGGEALEELTIESDNAEPLADPNCIVFWTSDDEFPSGQKTAAIIPVQNVAFVRRVEK